MSQKTPSQDSVSDIWNEMEKIEPLTPTPQKSKNIIDKSLDAYKEAAAYDDYMFGDYDYSDFWFDIKSNDVY